MQDAGRRDVYLQALQEIVAPPTAPFHEEHVAAAIGRHLRASGVPYRVDDDGNIIAHYQQGTPCRPLILMAHMDHPALTITQTGGPGGADYTAALEGGVAAQCFEREVPIKLFPRGVASFEQGLGACIVGYRRGEGPRDVDLYVRLDDAADAGAIAGGDFGVWDLPSFELRGDMVHARAIDDLAGCAAIVLALDAVAREGWPTDVYGVFTRAEEVGLVGARVLFESGVLPRDGIVVSLEASKALPGAQQGDGPVIRVGDRATTFSEGAELVLKAAAERLGSNVWHPLRENTVAVQRQLMSGGRCEASAAISAGYQATGLAFPLGNYHNVAADGSHTLIPETIDARDYLTGVALLQEAARVMPDLPRLEAEPDSPYGRAERYAERLRSSAARITA